MEEINKDYRKDELEKLGITFQDAQTAVNIECTPLLFFLILSQKEIPEFTVVTESMCCECHFWLFFMTIMV